MRLQNNFFFKLARYEQVKKKYIDFKYNFIGKENILKWSHQFKQQKNIRILTGHMKENKLPRAGRS